MQTRIDQLLDAAQDAQAAGERQAMRYYIGELERELEREKERVRRRENVR